MGVNIVLKLGDPMVPGESAIKGHEKEMDVLTWNWGLTQSASAHIATGAGTGSADVMDLTVTKYVDAATPTLLQEGFNGSDFKSATLTCIKVGGKAGPVEFVKMTMSGTVFISAIKTGEKEYHDGKATDRFIETLSLNFAKVKFEYTGQKEDQSKGASVSGEFNIAAKG
jgi:type VI secretion system secreted protein Hcp